MDLSPSKLRILRENLKLTPDERLAKFYAMTAAAWAGMSEEGRRAFHERNHKLRVSVFKDGKWVPLNRNI
jgi:hypothetical protein